MVYLLIFETFVILHYKKSEKNQTFKMVLYLNNVYTVLTIV